VDAYKKNKVQAWTLELAKVACRIIPDADWNGERRAVLYAFFS